MYMYAKSNNKLLMWNEMCHLISLNTNIVYELQVYNNDFGSIENWYQWRNMHKLRLWGWHLFIKAHGEFDCLLIIYKLPASRNWWCQRIIQRIDKILSVAYIQYVLQDASDDNNNIRKNRIRFYQWGTCILVGFSKQTHTFMCNVQ